MVADKGKKQKVEEKEENHIDKELVLSIEKLQEIQDELEKINEEASDKVLEVEQKYSEIRKPVYQKRNDIIKSIPDFWLTAFLSHPVLSELLTEEDQKIFKFLSSIEVEDSKDVKSGYSIIFNFKSNPYFEDTKLMKSYAFQEEGATQITATPIKWKEGMQIPNGVANEKKGNKRPPPEESFFTWFSETQQKDEDMDDIHDEVAELIREDLWPDPLSYFNNQEADDEEFEGDDEEKGSDGSEDDEEQDGGDDDDEDGDEDDD
ncbi:PREDICTED: NAP1-related protein 2-like isoform X1 [Ipomoea nil]|uniref:NAP1-related protein 2-like isoform X1 n=1 Tax=Ipomoea nil TaxID=35883 RepID=UPI0009018D84|nr:PREDICTED: NAP1-related protein 2-like isoform X1 [Ipomoea nil]